MDLADLVDQTYGPKSLRVSADVVADFVEVTADDPKRWQTAAPPGFAAAALFVVAPELLDELSDRSVIHGEQSFVWQLPIEVGSLLDVTGRVTRVRERRGVHFVEFELEASQSGDPVLVGSSLFVVSGESIPAHADFERREPPHSYRGDPGPGQFSASRDDLVRYAAATRDWNAIHWDHDAAVAAGFPGVVVHGLFQAAWAFSIAAGYVADDRPLESGSVRFRSPLLPARPVDVAATKEGQTVAVTVSDKDETYVTARLELADE